MTDSKFRVLQTAGGVFTLVVDSPESQQGLWLLVTKSRDKSLVTGLSTVRLVGVLIILIPLCRKSHCDTYKRYTRNGLISLKS